jgi:uncharacterized protein (TIGR02118 family)
MVKLIALFRTPPDPAGFDTHYDTVHKPLLRAFPGLRKLEITRITGAPIGTSRYHLLCEIYFDSKDAMDEALASPQGRAVARDLMGFAPDLVTVFHGDVAD